MEANHAGKKVTRLLSFAPDDWVLHPTTGLCTRLLGFAARNDWALQLGFAPDYWALHPSTGLCTRLLGFHPNTEVLLEY